MMRISYICGLCVINDAISNSIRDEINWLVSVPNNKVCLFTYACDFHELPFTIVRELDDVIFNTFFQECDLVIFHFGIYYPLFNLLLMVPNCAKSIVVFHNITPKEFLPSSIHETIDKSIWQMSNIKFASHVICISELNQRALALNGINVASTILPLALRGRRHPPRVKPSFADGITRIIFVGRFVKSKGPIDLLIAISRILEKRHDIFVEINFVGNLKLSDSNVVEELNSESNEQHAKFGSRLIIKIHGNAKEYDKNNLMANSDIFVLPSRHEGFCVPILEAFENGCCVVAYDNSNIPSISGGFAFLVPTGNTSFLAKTISNTIDLTRTNKWIFEAGYTNYCLDLIKYYKKFDPEIIKNNFLYLVQNIFKDLS